MKRIVLFVFLPIVVLLAVSVFGTANDGASDQVVFAVPVEDDAATISAQCADCKYVDERIRAVESDAQQKIQAILGEIGLLADKSDEAELQKDIERIKRDAEVARLGIEMEIAEDGGDFEAALKITEELEHLRKLEEPVVSFAEEQPAP